jgi:hypothetical protein
LQGLTDRPRPWTGPPVATYDLFRVEPYTITKFFGEDPSVRVGDSFRDRFDANIARFDVPHVVYEGDITEIGWPGGPIDVLFLDVLKTGEVNDAILRDFFPALRPGRSVIVHQDYGSGWLPWIPITVELMHESLQLIDGMEWGSHVFFLEGEVPAELIERGVTGLELATKFELIDRAIARSEGWVRGMIELGRTHLVVERDGVEAGLQDLERIAERYPHHAFVLSSVQHVTEGLETNWTFERSGDEDRRKRRLAEARRRVTAALFGG